MNDVMILIPTPAGHGNALFAQALSHRRLQGSSAVDNGEPCLSVQGRLRCLCRPTIRWGGEVV